MAAADPIRTDRLLLRPITADDLDYVHDVQSRSDVTRYLLFDVRNREEARQALLQKMQAPPPDREGGSLTLAVVLPATGAVIGDVVLFCRSEQHRQGEIGYIFHPDCAGRGYATEAARALLGLAFAEFGLHRITGRIDARNAASARVLQRLGMRLEAHFAQNEFIKGEWTDEIVYAILDHEWKPR